MLKKKKNRTIFVTQFSFYAIHALKNLVNIMCELAEIMKTVRALKQTSLSDKYMQK